MRYIENRTLFVSHYYINAGSMIVQVIENHYDRKCFSYLIRLRTRQCGYKSGKPKYSTLPPSHPRHNNSTIPSLTKGKTNIASKPKPAMKLPAFVDLVISFLIKD